MDRAYLHAVPIAFIAFLLSLVLRDVKLRSAAEHEGGPVTAPPLAQPVSPQV